MKIGPVSVLLFLFIHLSVLWVSSIIEKFQTENCETERGLSHSGEFSFILVHPSPQGVTSVCAVLN